MIHHIGNLRRSICRALRAFRGGLSLSGSHTAERNLVYNSTTVTGRPLWLNKSGSRSRTSGGTWASLVRMKPWQGRRTSK